MRSTFKVLLYVKKGSEKPNGNLPLMCRLTVDGEIKQFSCKMDVPLRLWDVKNDRASGKSIEAQRINLAVDKIRVEVNRRYQELMQTDGVRLCADDIMTRQKLKTYQDSYAQVMGRYGLQRGIDGSEAKHISTRQYYRDLVQQKKQLQTDIGQLQDRRETVQEELRWAKREIQIEKLKGAATTAAANIAESVSSLFGSNKVRTLERENKNLHREVATHEGTIENLQDTIQSMQTDHSRQVLEMQRQHHREMEQKEAEHRKEVSGLMRLTEKLCAWFPLAKEILRMEKLCRLIGFDERQTATLVSGKPLEYEGELYSEEHRQKFTTGRADFKVVKDPADKEKLILSINRKPIGNGLRSS